MRIMSIAACLVLVTFASSLAAMPRGQAANGTIEQQLAAQFQLTTINRSGQIVTAGSMLVLQKPGLLMYSVANPMAPQSTYKNGKFSRNALGRGFGADLVNALNKPGPSAEIDQRNLAAGELVWVTKVDMRKDGVVFRLYSNPYGYFGEVKFPFTKNVVPPADQMLGTISEVLTVQPGDPQAAPPTAEAAPAAQAAPPDQAPPQPQTQTLTLGMTIEQVVGAMGQPERIANLGSKKIYSYKDMKITFVDGKVTDIQ